MIATRQAPRAGATLGVRREIRGVDGQAYGKPLKNDQMFAVAVRSIV